MLVAAEPHMQWLAENGCLPTFRAEQRQIQMHSDQHKHRVHKKRLTKRSVEAVGSLLIVSSWQCISAGQCHTPLQGIIHRDLKANNIFCSAHGIVKLGDFGISKALGDNQNVARTMVGTPYYMSPEILKV